MWGERKRDFNSNHDKKIAIKVKIDGDLKTQSLHLKTTIVLRIVENNRKGVFYI